MAACLPAYRNDETTTQHQLVFQRWWDFGSTRGDENRVEWGRVRPALGAIAHAHLDVVVAERFKTAHGSSPQHGMSLDCIDALCDLADDRSGVT